MSHNEENIESTNEINNCSTYSVNLKNWASEVGWIVYKVILVLILSIILILIAKSICGFLFWNDPIALFNSTLFASDNVDTKATLLGMSANVILTTSLIVVTAFYALDTHAMLKQSKEKQRIEYIEKSLENFYLPVQDILKDKQYVLPSLVSPKSQPHYEENLEKYKLFFPLSNPITQYSPQAVLYHVQSVELKKFGLYKYRAKKLTLNLFFKVTTMEAYNIHFKDYQNDMNSLLDYTKKDFDNLLKSVEKDIKDYQEELNQLTKNPYN